MAYTPDAEDTAQPTGNQALSTAALEFRTLKTYIQATKTAQDVRDDAQETATALVSSNLATALVTQDTRDDAQDTAISTAQNTATAALALAAGRLQRVVLTGSGNWVVPADVTEVVVLVQGGGSCDAEYLASDWWALNWSFYSEPTAGELVVASVAVTAGASIAYVCGVGQEVHRDPTTGGPATPCYMKSFIDAGDSYFYSAFETVRARAAITRYAVNVNPAVSRADANFGFSGYATGKLEDTRISNAAYTPNVINQTVGKAGSIIILY